MDFPRISTGKIRKLTNFVVSEKMFNKIKSKMWNGGIAERSMNIFNLEQFIADAYE